MTVNHRQYIEVHNHQYSENGTTLQMEIDDTRLRSLVIARADINHKRNLSANIAILCEKW